MKALFLVTLITFTALIVSCKKDKDDLAATTLAKVKQKWQIDSIIIIENVNGYFKKTTHQGTPNEYIEFKSDGRMYTYFQGNYDNSSYSIKSDTVIVIGGDSGDIEKITDTVFIFATRANAGSIGYIEVKYHLKR